VAGPEPIPVGRVLVACAAVAIFLGTVVTGAGPHAGSHDGELIDRLPFTISAVARLHSLAVWLFLAVAAYLVVGLRRSGAPAAVVQRGTVLLLVVVAQGAIGYAQYFSGVPAFLVAVHIAGAVAVWVATLRLVLSLRTRALVPVEVAA
jgi:cytochrome c oxidase assembly protein subunit 15